LITTAGRRLRRGFDRSAERFIPLEERLLITREKVDAQMKPKTGVEWKKKNIPVQDKIRDRCLRDF